MTNDCRIQFKASILFGPKKAKSQLEEWAAKYGLTLSTKKKKKHKKPRALKGETKQALGLYSVSPFITGHSLDTFISVMFIFFDFLLIHKRCHLKHSGKSEFSEQ